MEWDRYWSKGTWITRFVDWIHKNCFSTLFASRVTKFVRQGSHVLDAGCGSGITSRKLQDAACCSVVGLDLSLPALSRASRYLADVVRADMRCLPFASHMFDVVYNQGVMEHFSSPEEAGGDLRRVLKRDGLLVFLVPYCFSPLRFIYELMKELGILRFWIGEEQAFLSRNQLWSLLQRCGCRPLLIERIWLTTLLGLGVGTNDVRN